MTRVTESQLLRNNLSHIGRSRDHILKLNDQIGTGLKVANPSDSELSATIEKYRQTLDQLDSYANRTAGVKSFLTFQDDALSQVGELLTRAREIASQASNSTNSPETRAQMAEEVFQIRDHLVQLANSRYQGKYVWGGGASGSAVPPYVQTTDYANGTGKALERYEFDTSEVGRSVTRTVNISEGLTLDIDTPGNQVFDNALFGLERLGRSLAGYQTNPATGAPDGTGNAYTFPADYELQTTEIRAAMDMLKSAQDDDIQPQRVTLGGKLRRIETAESMLQLGKGSVQEALDKLQNADIAESASNLTQAQTVLQAALAVTSRVLNQTILDYV